MSFGGKGRFFGIKFWNDDKTKKSEFDLGSAFFGISEVDFLPMGTE